MKRFLIVKTSALGDIVQSFFALSLLKQIHPKAKIHWVAEKMAKELLEDHPYIDEVICLESKKWKKHPWRLENRKAFLAFVRKLRSHYYDAVFDLQGNCKSGCITFLTKAQYKVGFNKLAVTEWPNILATNYHIAVNTKDNLRMQYTQIIRSFFSYKDPLRSDLFLEKMKNTIKYPDKILGNFLHRERTKIMICPFSRWKNKQLSVKKLCDVLSFLVKDIDPVFLFIAGNIEEKTAAQVLALHFAERSKVLYDQSLPILLHLIDRMDLVIGVDSLLLHLAEWTTTPTISFFGPSSGYLYSPLGDRHLVFQGKCPYGFLFHKRCKRLRDCISGACMEDISLDGIIEKIKNWEFYKELRKNSKLNKTENLF